VAFYATVNGVDDTQRTVHGCGAAPSRGRVKGSLVASRSRPINNFLLRLSNKRAGCCKYENLTTSFTAFKDYKVVDCAVGKRRAVIVC
jgi:hypothetical protein